MKKASAKSLLLIGIIFGQILSINGAKASWWNSLDMSWLTARGDEQNLEYIDPLDGQLQDVKSDYDQLKKESALFISENKDSAFGKYPQQFFDRIDKSLKLMQVRIDKKYKIREEGDAEKIKLLSGTDQRFAEDVQKIKQESLQLKTEMEQLRELKKRKKGLEVISASRATFDDKIATLKGIAGSENLATKYENMLLALAEANQTLNNLLQNEHFATADIQKAIADTDFLQAQMKDLAHIENPSFVDEESKSYLNSLWDSSKAYAYATYDSYMQSLLDFAVRKGTEWVISHKDAVIIGATEALKEFNDSMIEDTQKRQEQKEQQQVQTDSFSLLSVNLSAHAEKRSDDLATPTNKAVDDLVNEASRTPEVVLQNYAAGQKDKLESEKQWFFSPVKRVQPFTSWLWRKTYVPRVYLLSPLLIPGGEIYDIYRGKSFRQREVATYLQSKKGAPYSWLWHLPKYRYKMVTDLTEKKVRTVETFCHATMYPQIKRMADIVKKIWIASKEASENVNVNINN